MSVKPVFSRLLRTTAAVLLAAVSACRPPCAMPTGHWRSDNGRADISIVEKADGEYSAVVYHRIYGGGICPVEYPVVRTATGAYIRAEGRIIISFDEEKDVMFLSPGGTYRRKAVRCPDGNLTIRENEERTKNR